MPVKVTKKIKPNDPAAKVIAFSDFGLPNDTSDPPIWLDLCQKTKDKPNSNLANAMIALRIDPALAGAIAFDEMAGLSMLMKPLPKQNISEFAARPLKDEDVTAIREFLQLCGLKSISKATAHDAVDFVAAQNSFHPLRKQLNELVWDGVSRVDSWLSVYLGCANSVYVSAVGRMFLISMIARVFEPGCKADYMLVLEGPQGIGKSTACAILGGDWFSDNLPDVTGGKDVKQHLKGKWLIEIAEMSAMSKAESSHLKAFLTTRIDQYRPSYARKPIEQPRQCIFIGTTNLSEYLRDETGGRRFWPVCVGKIQIEKLEKDRDKLFAEALELYRQGHKWHPNREFERKYILPEQEARFEADTWEDTIKEYLLKNEFDKIKIGLILANALQIDTQNRSTRNERRVRAILQKIGWKKESKKDAEGNFWWVRHK
ncbi:VapE domain-containing protein [Microbaculum sp. FT89]|uniref:VapE domain-containing protein n=1 Tax=Microbaculum sp. FT89 TaxID=3447298 RepID=UPI003F53CBE0